MTNDWPIAVMELNFPSCAVGVEDSCSHGVTQCKCRCNDLIKQRDSAWLHGIFGVRSHLRWCRFQWFSLRLFIEWTVIRCVVVFRMERVSDVADNFTVCCLSYFWLIFNHTYDLVIEIVLFSIYVFYVEANNNNRLIVLSSRHYHALRG